MRLINKSSEKEKYFPVQQQPANNKLFVAHRNDQIMATGRTTTVYRASDETNDPAYAGSFYLLPDPYCENRSEDREREDFLLEQEEMILYDLPLVTNYSLHKI